MKTIFYIILTVFVVHVANSLDFPSIPDTYTTGIEIKTNWNGSYMIFTGSEARKSNKYAIHYDLFHREGGRNRTRVVAMKSVVVILDYERDLGRTIIELQNGRKQCRRVFNISDTNMTEIDESKGPVVTTLTLLGSNETRNYTYIGTDKVRNLNCHRWQRHKELNNETVDYYFQENDNGEMVLLRITESNSGFHRHSIYDYFAFKNAMPTYEELDAPMGTYCKTKNPFDAPKLPDKLTLSMEYRPLYQSKAAKIPEMVIGLKLFWDPHNHRTRTDHHIKVKGEGWVPIKDITDSKHDVHYEIYSPTKCQTKEYNPTAEILTPFFKNKGHWIHLLKAIEHYRLNTKKDEMNFVYEGQHIVRGITTDVWIYKSDNLGQEGFNEIEWYFNTPKVIEVSSMGKEWEQQIPVRIVGYYGNNTDEFFEMDIFDFRHNVNDEDFVQPIKSCLQTTDSVYAVTLFIEGIPRESRDKMHDITDLKNKTTQAILKAAGLSDSDRLIIEITVGSDYIMLSLSIIDFPYQPSATTTTAEKLANKLLDKIKDGKISFTYHVNNDTKHTVKLTTYDTTECKDKTNDDVVIALVILVVVFFFIGIAVTYFALDCVVRRNGKLKSLKVVLRDRKEFVNEEGPNNNTGVTTTTTTTTETEMA